MKETENSIVEGIFFKIPVKILNKKIVHILNQKKLLHHEFRPQCDKICMYLYREGFANRDMHVNVETPE